MDLRINGRLSVKSVRPDGSIRDQREGDNTMCTAGLTALASALVWSGLQDQAASLGLTSPTYLTPLWGAVGDGVGTPSASDTLLFNELDRQTVGAGAGGPATASIPAQFTWLFYFPSPATTWTVREAGVFANGTVDSFSVAVAGTLLDHWAFSVPLSVPTTDTLILQATFSLSGV